MGGCKRFLGAFNYFFRGSAGCKGASFFLPKKKSRPKRVRTAWGSAVTGRIMGSDGFNGPSDGLFAPVGGHDIAGVRCVYQRYCGKRALRRKTAVREGLRGADIGQEGIFMLNFAACANKEQPFLGGARL